MANSMVDGLDMASYGSGFYMQYLESLCQRRGWPEPQYECRRDANGYLCLVLVNGREYTTDWSYESDTLAQENAAMRAFMVCRNFSVNGGLLARNGTVQGLPPDAVAHPAGRLRKPRHSTSHGQGGQAHWDRPREASHRHEHSSSSSSTTSYDGE